ALSYKNDTPKVSKAIVRFSRALSVRCSKPFAPKTWCLDGSLWDFETQLRESGHKPSLQRYLSTGDSYEATGSIHHRGYRVPQSQANKKNRPVLRRDEPREVSLSSHPLSNGET